MGRNVDGTLYESIAKNLMSDIGEGVWKVGDQLPAEQSLASRYNVSRFTIRSALDCLQAKGMISRKRRLGTTVLSDFPVETIVQEINSLSELFQYPEGTRLRVLKTSSFSADISVANFLGCAAGTRWTKIETIRQSHSKSPICLTEIYVPEAYREIKDHIGKSSKPAFKLLEDKYNIKAVEINAEILAGTISQLRADLLQVEDESATLILIRRYRDSAGNLLEVSTSEHPASRFTYSFNLSYRR